MAQGLRQLLVLCTTLVVVLSGCQSYSPVEPDREHSIQLADDPCNPEVRPC
jgi:predicted component of type VI protein secretion system